jgi:hypothetical protein
MDEREIKSQGMKKFTQRRLNNVLSLRDITILNKERINSFGKKSPWEKQII